MSSPSSPALQRLYRLDRSLPDFHDQLYETLYGREYAQCEQNLEGDDLMWLVGYLDEVRRHNRSSSPFVQVSIGSRWSRSF